MKQTVRGRKKPGRRSDDKTKYARLLAIPAAIVLVLLIVILVMDKKPGSSKNTEDTTVSEASDISIEGDTESSTDDASIEPDNNEYNQDFSAYELQKDANPQVNELISTYFQAKVDQDAQMLYKVFGKEEDDRIEERKQQLNQNLMLFFTGFSRFSSDIQQTTEKALVDKQKQLLEMLSLVDDAEKVLTSKTALKEFGRLLDYTWKLKRGISNRISTDSIDGLYAKGMAAGALGGKLLGAGGGGFLLFYVEPDKQEAVHKAMEELLYVPFEFENSGTRVIHYTPETYEKR